MVPYKLFVSSCLLLASGLIVVACGDDDTSDSAGTQGVDSGPDTGSDTGSLTDSGTTDTGSLTDSGTTDTGAPTDSGTTDTGSDTGSLTDSGTDTGTLDAGTCCDQLAGATTIEWLSSSGVLPTEACPIWNGGDSAEPEAPTITSGALVIDTSDDAENVYYEHSGSEIETNPTGTVVIQANLRLISGSASTTSRAPAVVYAILGAAKKKAVLQIESGHIFLNSDENVRGPEAAIDTTTAARTYVIEIDVATGAIGVLVDGVPTLSGNTFTEPSSNTNVVGFGEASLYAHGQSEWHSVKHTVYDGCTPP
jgi:hypothetical protein